MAIDDGAPAFPVPPDERRGIDQHCGMSLRDYFAAAALAGYIAWSPAKVQRNDTPENAAKLAYEFADAMLKARKET